MNEQDASRARAQVETFAAEHGLVIAGTYPENESGAKLSRPELFRLIADSKPGDVLLVEQIDRLSRLKAGDWNKLRTERSQLLLQPEAVDDYVGSDNPVRFIDAFVGGLDLVEAGFAGVQPKATGRPGYAPGDLLKPYIYGYLNRVRSSRRLEAECHRNLEVIWLLRTLDHVSKVRPAIRLPDTARQAWPAASPYRLLFRPGSRRFRRGPSRLLNGCERYPRADTPSARWWSVSDPACLVSGRAARSSLCRSRSRCRQESRWARRGSSVAPPRSGRPPKIRRWRWSLPDSSPGNFGFRRPRKR